MTFPWDQPQSNPLTQRSWPALPLKLPYFMGFLKNVNNHRIYVCRATQTTQRLPLTCTRCDSVELTGCLSMGFNVEHSKKKYSDLFFKQITRLTWPSRPPQHCASSRGSGPRLLADPQNTPACDSSDRWSPIPGTDRHNKRTPDLLL